MKSEEKNLVVYQTQSGALEIRQDAQNETIWATQKQIAEIFGIERSVITKHIGNLFKEQEVDEKSNVQIMHISGSDRPVKFYSLDIILAVGYRTNSVKAIQFRKWATETLKQHITQGFTINQTRIEKNREVFLQAVEDIRLLSSGVSEVSMDKVLDLVEVFAETWFALDQYDKGSFPEKGTVESIRIEVDELEESLKILKQELVTKGEAGELFAQEKNVGSLEGIVGNIYQSVYGMEVYTSVEEKAAHLLYFMVKNHPFTDGNKRSGAFAFVWFFQKAGFEFQTKITPETLTTLTILIAESDPKDKERVIGLILLLLK